MTGINNFKLSGFVQKHIILFESRKGTPACRFVISAGEKGYTFLQNIVIYGTRAIELAKTLEQGDLVFADGSLMHLPLAGPEGFKIPTPCLVSNLCYILETKEQWEARQNS